MWVLKKTVFADGFWLFCFCFSFSIQIYFWYKFSLIRNLEPNQVAHHFCINENYVKFYCHICRIIRHLWCFNTHARAYEKQKKMNHKDKNIQNWMEKWWMKVDEKLPAIKSNETYEWKILFDFLCSGCECWWKWAERKIWLCRKVKKVYENR